MNDRPDSVTSGDGVVRGGVVFLLKSGEALRFSVTWASDMVVVELWISKGSIAPAICPQPLG